MTHDSDPSLPATPAAAPEGAAGAPSGAGERKGTARSIKQIGWLLAWAVVFCDIGTSVYYVPGILYHHVGNLAPYFILLTTVGFLLLAQKYAEVTWSFPAGGGVVSVAHAAFGQWWGCIGGILITSSYFLTSAISSVSGFEYLSSVFPALKPHVVLLSCLGIGLLGVLNIIGIRESAIVAFGMAGASFLVNLVVIVVGFWHLQPQEVAVVREAAGHFSQLPMREILIGFAAAWLAFSGLESISQLSPALKLPIKKTVRYAIVAVVATILLTSPTLAILSTAIIPESMKASGTDSMISDLAYVRSGLGLRISVVATASALLLFAANTAMIGGYHVFLALSRDRFFPRIFAKRSQRYSTPHWAILITAVVPIATILMVEGKLTQLGDMYSFGLLGAFAFTSIGLDVLRWRDRSRGWIFGVGLLTSIMVLGSWGINIVVKPLATIYGGVLTAIGLAAALAVRREWIIHAVNRIPWIAERAGALRSQTEFAVEEEEEIVTLQSAVAMRPLYPSTTLVAMLNYNAKLMDEALHRVKGEGEHALYIISVTEWPGLFSGADSQPSDEVIQSMNRMVRHARDHDVFAIPIWAISDNAARTIAEAAGLLDCTAVMLGVSQRSAIYHMLRGTVLRGLTRLLPDDFRIITVG